jgi:long-chain fatty acid transport protein
MKRLLLLLLAVTSASTLWAEGYQVNNLSTRQTGMGHVGVAMKLGAESIYFNPAATAFQEGRFDLSIGAAGILSYCTYTQSPIADGSLYSNEREKWHSHNKMSTPLYAYFNYKPCDRVAVGVGFFTPDGSSVNWGENWPGANLVQKINLAAYTVQPTVSFKLTDRLSVGAGLMVTWGNFDLSRSMLSTTSRQTLINETLDPKIAQLEAAVQAGMTDYQATLQTLQGAKSYLEGTLDQSIVSAKLEGNANVAVGVNAGFLFDVNDRWSLAMSYRSRMNMKVKNGHGALSIDATAAALLSQLSSLSSAISIPQIDQGTFSTELPLPTTVTWAVSFRPASRWQLAVDLQWVGWSAYKELNVTFNEPELGIAPIRSVKNYSNTLAFRFGGEYEACKWLTTRMGMYVDESPVSSDYLNPETPSMTKAAYTAGISLHPTEHFSIDLAYAHITSADPERTGSYPVYSYSDNTKLESVFAGNYKLRAHVISFGIGLKF